MNNGGPKQGIYTEIRLGSAIDDLQKMICDMDLKHRLMPVNLITRYNLVE